MSQYIHFFIRVGDRFVPIYTRSRSSILFQVASHRLPYEGVRAVKESDIIDWKSYIRDEIKKAEKSIAIQRNQIEEVAKFNNSLEDKIDFINEATIFIEDTEAEKESMERAIAFLDLLMDIWEEADGTKYYKKEHPNEVIDPNKYIYAGIECGWPTLEDVEGEDNETEEN